MTSWMASTMEQDPVSEKEYVLERKREKVNKQRYKRWDIFGWYVGGCLIVLFHVCPYIFKKI